MRKFAILLTTSFLLTSCISTQAPVQEYTLAKAAFEAAVAAEAVKFAPQLYHKAERSYKKAELLYKERYYEEAVQEFVIAQKLSERAELAARLKQFHSGESNGY